MGRCEVDVLKCMTPLVHALTYIRGAAIWHGRKKMLVLVCFGATNCQYYCNYTDNYILL